MSFLHPGGRGRYDPRDLVIWRDDAGTKPGLTADIRDLQEIALVEMNCTLDAPWELVMKERVKTGANSLYGKWYFDLKQQIWVTDRNSAPNTEGSIGPATTRVVYSGRVIARSTEKGPDGDHYIYRCTDRRGLMRFIPVTFGGPGSPPESTIGPNRLVYNAPPNDADLAFDRLGGDRADLLAILTDYFTLFNPALSAVAGIPAIPGGGNFAIEGFVPEDLVPSKIVLEDVDFEQGLNQILAGFPYIRWYVTPGFFQPQVVFVSPLRLTKTHIIQYPDFDSPAADAPISTSQEVNIEGVYTAVKIVAKTGKIKNNWTRMQSGLGFEYGTTDAGAASVPRQAPEQPGKTVGIKVSTGNCAYYEDWADSIRLNRWGGNRYWDYAGVYPVGLPDGGGGTKQPIYGLQMWEKRFESDLRGDAGASIWTGYRQPEILGGHYYSSKKSSGDSNVAMVRTTTDGSGGFEQIPPLVTSTIDLAADNGWIYKLTDTQRFWYTASLVGSAEPGGGIGATTLRRRRGPWAGGLLVIPPQPGDARPLGMKDPARSNDPIRLQIQITNGVDIWATVVPEQRPFVSNANWAGPANNAIWGYEVHEPGNKLQGPDSQFYTIGGRWSSMYRNYRLFDPEMVWQYVDSAGGTTRPRFASFAPEVCFVGLWTTTATTLSPGHTGPIPDPTADPTGAWKQTASTSFYPLFPKVGGDPDINSAFFSTGPKRAYDAREDPPASGLFSIYPAAFDVQFGWYELGGGLEARWPDGGGFAGEGAGPPYNINREKVIGVDLSEYIDVADADFGPYGEPGRLGARLLEIAHQYWRTLNKVPRIGQITLDGLDLDLCTRVGDPGGDPTGLKPFTYYIAQDIDQADLKPPPSGQAADASAAATVGIRYDFEGGSTAIDITEDRSGLQRDLISELQSELRSRQLVLDIRNTVQGFKAFSHCIQTGEGGAGGGTGFGGGPTDLCSFQLPHPEDAARYISICALLGIMWVRGGKKGPVQPKFTTVHAPITDGVSTTGGMVEFDVDPDVNTLTHRFDEFPNHPLAGPPLHRDEFNRRGSQALIDSHLNWIVANYYGQKSRYTLLGASLDPVDDLTLRLDSTIDPVLAGWGTGPVLAFLRDFLGLVPEFGLEIAEDEVGAPVPFSIPSQTIGLPNGDLASWRFYEPDEVPSDCVLYLDFEEASGSLYDKSRYKHVLAVAGTPTFSAPGLVTGELGITYVQGSSSHALASVPIYSPLAIEFRPFTFLLRFKLNATGIAQALVTNYAGSNGVKIEIDTANKLVLTVGDGSDTVSVTFPNAMSSGNWYSYLVFFNHIDATITISDGTQEVGLDPQVVGYVSNTSKAFTISGSVTWDELAFIVGDAAVDLFNRIMLPASWRLRRPLLSKYDFTGTSVDTADANGGVAALVVSVASGASTSPVVVYQDTETDPDLVLIPGHTYRLTIKNKTGSGVPTLAPWVENLDQRTVLTSAGAFTEGDTALTIPSSSSEWTANETVFTVPLTYNAWDRWRIGVRIGSSAGTVTAKFGGDPAFLLEEIPANEESEEFKLLDSQGTRLAELDADSRVAEIA